MAEYLAVGMARAGADVGVAPLSKPPTGLSEEFKALPRGEPAADAPTLYCSWPRPELQRFRSTGLFINTMWESSALPKDWPAALNRARAVIVPTRFVARVFRDSGVHVPIHVIPDGVDPAVYSYLTRPADRPVTTLIVGALEPRKHIRAGIAAWQRAFAADPEARLIVKTNADIEHRDPRIRIITEQDSTRGIAHWYAQADVLLALGNEGFGLPLIEAMASGLPVIALNAEGQSDTCADAGDCIIAIAPTTWEPHDSSLFGTCGVRAVPDVDAVAEQLSWVATHRAEAKAMGRAASEWVLRNRNVWRKGEAALDVMEQHVQRPLRRGVHLWVTSWRKQCGVAEYTAHLAEGLRSSVHVSAQAPELARTRIVHVQHQYGLYDETGLAQTCAAARAAGVPVVVTEHMVRADAPRFERDADVLVSMSEAGVETLRRRWPSTRVEHIPHGCPTWFPRRKQRRGRVIGSFGFMAPHKGFLKLAELARTGLRLVLYSAPGSDEAESKFAAATRDADVRRDSRFLPVEEVARRLAAEADVLLFWYDEVDAATVSGAVRVGLATGVPVLTSPTTWFADLREVTYQPADLEAGVHRLIEDTRLRRHLVEAATEYCHAHSWARIAERHLALWRSVEN
jgi:glycosyltransferase involved in cell wall biosynthesis